MLYIRYRRPTKTSSSCFIYSIDIDSIDLSLLFSVRGFTPQVQASFQAVQLIPFTEDSTANHHRFCTHRDSNWGAPNRARCSERSSSLYIIYVTICAIDKGTISLPNTSCITLIKSQKFIYSTSFNLSRVERTLVSCLGLPKIFVNMIQI